ncbi:MAG: MATE family efflux transporter [Tissierellia bacterium]|nr:MATE family efflux transporter [Tissierellia bacterium]
MKNNMTEGNLFKALLYFTMPLIISGFLQQMYNIVDSIIVGNFVGEAALAAVGISAPVLNIVIFITTGFVSGYTILLSQHYGAKDYSQITKLSSTIFSFLALSVTLVAILGFIFIDKILILLNTPVEIIKPAYDYLSIIFLGVPFLVLYNLFSAMLKGIGNSKTPLHSIILSTLINIVLDLVFINIFRWGVKGAAIATVIAQVSSCLFLIVSIAKHQVLRIYIKKEFIKLAVLTDILRLSLPLVIQSTVGSFGMLFLQKIMNSFGVDVVTAITTAYKIDSLTILPLINLSSAISIFTAQNIGANNMTRAKEGLKKGIIISLVVSISVTTILVLGGWNFMKLFGVSDEVANIGQRFFYTLAFFYPILGIEHSIYAFLQGNKDVIFTCISSMSSLILRVIMSYTLATLVGPDIIAISEISAWVFAAILCFARYKSNRWNHAS